MPVDADNVAQFFYHHLLSGSPELEHGGLRPTRPLPKAVDFPLAADRGTHSAEQHCLIGGAIQTYDRQEFGFARQGTFTDLSERTEHTSCSATLARRMSSP